MRLRALGRSLTGVSPRGVEGLGSSNSVGGIEGAT